MDRFVRVYEYFELDTILHWQPVQFYENGRDVFMFSRPGDHSCRCILNTLEFICGRTW